VALGKGGRDVEENLQPLCRTCHLAKTQSEGRAPLGYLKSRFNKDVYDKYLMSPKPPCINYKDEGVEEFAPGSQIVVTKSLMADLNRSRHAALYNAPELPVFTPLDQIKPIVRGEPLPDLVYVNKERKATDLPSLLEELPYHGPAWYSKVAIEYCLHTYKLDWEDLMYGLQATGHVPNEEVRAALDAMDAAWEGIETNAPRPEKRCVNDMVGVFGMSPGGTRIKSWMSFKDERIEHRGFKVLKGCNEIYGCKDLFEQRTTQLLMDPSSYRPLFDLCLCTEHVRLAQCYYALQTVFKKKQLTPAFLFVNTDGICFEKPRKNKTPEEIKEILQGMTFKQLPRLGDYLRDCLKQPEPQQKKLRTAQL
jgi:hypothetical protein